MYDLTNIFEVFLPQLLLYPNPTDPLNAEAAAMQLKGEEGYHKKIKDYVARHAMPKGSSSLVEETKEECKTSKEKQESEKKLESASTNPTNEKEEDDDYIEKKHDSELSATSDIEMMDIEDDDDP